MTKPFAGYDAKLRLGRSVQQRASRAVGQAYVRESGQAGARGMKVDVLDASWTTLWTGLASTLILTRWRSFTANVRCRGRAGATSRTSPPRGRRGGHLPPIVDAAVKATTTRVGGPEARAVVLAHDFRGGERGALEPRAEAPRTTASNGKTHPLPRHAGGRVASRAPSSDTARRRPPHQLGRLVAASRHAAQSRLKARSPH